LNLTKREGEKWSDEIQNSRPDPFASRPTAAERLLAPVKAFDYNAIAGFGAPISPLSAA
jgi:hypothetical protein